MRLLGWAPNPGAALSATLSATLLLVVLPGCSLIESIGDRIIESVGDKPQSGRSAASGGEIRGTDLSLAVQRWAGGLSQSRVVVNLPEHCPHIAVAGVAWQSGAAPGDDAEPLVTLIEEHLAESGDWSVTAHEVVTADPAVADFAAAPGDTLSVMCRQALHGAFEVCFAVHGRVGDRVHGTGADARARPYLFLRVTDCRSSRVVYQELIDLP